MSILLFLTEKKKDENYSLGKTFRAIAIVVQIHLCCIKTSRSIFALHANWKRKIIYFQSKNACKPSI